MVWMTDEATVEEIRSLPWDDVDDSGAMDAVLEVAEHDDLSAIVNSLIHIDRNLLPATLTAHVKRRRPELLKQRGGASSTRSSAAARSSTPPDDSAIEAGFDEVRQLCLEREEHRRSSNYTEADRVRDRLQSMGVTLEDKKHLFTMAGGEQGSYDLRQGELPKASKSSGSGAAARRHASPPRSQPPTRSAASVSTSLPPVKQVSHRGYASALEQCMDREHARKENDYGRADDLRDELAANGVTLDDRAHLFTMGSGLQGTYSLQKGMGIHEVRLCCLDREEARRDNDFHVADRIRDQLTSIGVNLEDKTHTFNMPDGQKGSYDLHIASGFDSSAPPSRSSHPQHPARGQVSYAASPGRDGDFTNIERQCLQRERARRDGDYATADRVRDQLSDLGVTLEDRTHSFILRDGRRGSYDLHFHEDSAAASRGSQYAMAAPPQMYPQQYQQHSGWAAPPLAAGGSGFSGYLQAYQACRHREEVRRDRDYREADRLRNELKAQGVECEDTSHTFTFRGLEGNYELRNQLNTREVECIALEREEARRDRDYSKSDAIRDWLAAQGVQLEDKRHSFTLPDGSTGSYDLHAYADEQASKRQRRR